MIFDNVSVDRWLDSKKVDNLFAMFSNTLDITGRWLLIWPASPDLKTCYDTIFPKWWIDTGDYRCVYKWQSNRMQLRVNFKLSNLCLIIVFSLLIPAGKQPTLLGRRLRWVVLAGVLDIGVECVRGERLCSCCCGMYLYNVLVGDGDAKSW